MRNKIYIAHCIPHTCDSGDVSKHVAAIIGKIPQNKITTNVGTVQCQTKTALPWSWGDYSFLYVPFNIHTLYCPIGFIAYILCLCLTFYCDIDDSTNTITMSIGTNRIYNTRPHSAENRTRQKMNENSVIE